MLSGHGEDIRLPGLGRVEGWRPRHGPKTDLQKSSSQGQRWAAEGERPLGVRHGRPEPPAPDFPIQLGGLGWGPVDSSAGHMEQDNLPDLASTNLQPGTVTKNSCEVSMLFRWLHAPYPVSGTPRITLACTNRVGDRKFSIIYIIKGTPEQCSTSWQVWVCQ